MPRPRPSKLEIEARQRAHEGFFKLDVMRLRHERYDGSMTPQLQRELLLQKPAVAVLPWEPRADIVVLVEQFRAGLVDAGERSWSLEAVAGLRDGTESPEAAALRELEEETALRAKALLPLGAYRSSPGATTERVDCYLAVVDVLPVDGPAGRRQEDEDILVLSVARSEAMAMIADGRIVAANGVIPLLRLALDLETLRAEALAALT